MPVALKFLSANSEVNDNEAVDTVGTCNESRNISVDT